MNFLTIRYQRSTSGWSSSKATCATQRSLAKRRRWCQEHIQWQCAQWRITSCCSEQMGVPESIDVIMNVIPPIVFWGKIVSVVVASWSYCEGNCINVSISTKVQTRLPRDQRPTKPVNRLVAGRGGKLSAIEIGYSWLGWGLGWGLGWAGLGAARKTRPPPAVELPVLVPSP